MPRQTNENEELKIIQNIEALQNILDEIFKGNQNTQAKLDLKNAVNSIQTIIERAQTKLDSLPSKDLATKDQNLYKDAKEFESTFLELRNKVVEGVDKLITDANTRKVLHSKLNKHLDALLDSLQKPVSAIKQKSGHFNAFKGIEEPVYEQLDNIKLKSDKDLLSQLHKFQESQKKTTTGNDEPKPDKRPPRPKIN